MVGCSAPNCTNSTRKGKRCFKFPADQTRRKKWLINCRRGGMWEPTKYSHLCEDHFEPCQYEQRRKDGWKKLKPNAIPTLFNVPNPPPPISSQFWQFEEDSMSKEEEDELLEVVECVPETECGNYAITTLQERNQILEDQIRELKEENRILIEKMTSFLSEEQISHLGQSRNSHWSADGIVTGLKLRLAIGESAYDHLFTMGYPTPSNSTLSKRLKQLERNFSSLTAFNGIKEEVQNSP